MIDADNLFINLDFFWPIVRFLRVSILSLKSLTHEGDLDY